MSNKRLFFAVKAVAIKKTGVAPTPTSGVLPLSASGYNPLHKWQVPRGVQSCAVTTTYNLETVFQQGQLDIYSIDENRPQIEMTINRVLDGTIPLYLMASDPSTSPSGVAADLNPRNASYQNDIALHVYPETNLRASGTADAKMLASGMFLSAITYTFPVDGPATEEIKFVGNNKFWNVGVSGSCPNNFFPSGGTTSIIPSAETAQTNAKAPAGITRRQHFLLTTSTLPGDIPAADRNAIQRVTVSTDLGRDEILALGRKDPYTRVIKYPIEVTSAFEVVTSDGDKIQARASVDSDTTNRSIVLKTKQGLTLDLGASNRLASIDFTGGDTSGGNVTVTYNYKTWNTLKISHAGYPVS